MVMCASGGEELREWKREMRLDLLDGVPAVVVGDCVDFLQEQNTIVFCCVVFNCIVFDRTCVCLRGQLLTQRSVEMW